MRKSSGNIALKSFSKRKNWKFDCSLSPKERESSLVLLIKEFMSDFLLLSPRPSSVRVTINRFSLGYKTRHRGVEQDRGVASLCDAQAMPEHPGYYPRYHPGYHPGWHKDGTSPNEATSPDDAPPKDDCATIAMRVADCATIAMRVADCATIATRVADCATIVTRVADCATIATRVADCATIATRVADCRTRSRSCITL